MACLDGCGVGESEVMVTFWTQSLNEGLISFLLLFSRSSFLSSYSVLLSL